jgi:methyl-accepting chemotaxis protein
MYKKFKLDQLIVCQTFLLLAISLGILFYFSHKVLLKEAMRDAELTLEGTAQTIDNILMDVEQSTGNIYHELMEHLDEPDRMYVYCRELVESNPNIVGCAIAFKPGYYPGKDLFMTYVHRRAFSSDIKSDLVTTDTFTDRPYTEQAWYKDPMNKGWIGWTDPLKGEDTENEPLVNFCLPFTDRSGERVGVISVNVSISKLSKILSAVKPSERGYSLLLAKSGSLIVHPDMDMLKSESILTKMVEGADHTYHDAIEAMLSGQSGMKKFYMNGESWSVFYKPFKRVEWEGRSDWQLDWSVGVVYPDADIHSVHNKLLYLVVAITIVGLLLFFLLCGWLVRHELKPLSLLTQLTQRIAAGNYDESVPATNREDEVGHLQNRLRKMQDRLKEQTADLENETMQLHEHSDELRAAYGRIEENDRMKTSFLHYITNQMAVPAESIDRSVTTLCNNYHDISKDEIDKQVDNIERKSDMLVELLNHMAHFTDAETGKEANHD